MLQIWGLRDWSASQQPGKQTVWRMREATPPRLPGRNTGIDKVLIQSTKTLPWPIYRTVKINESTQRQIHCCLCSCVYLLLLSFIFTHRNMSRRRRHQTLTRSHLGDEKQPLMMMMAGSQAAHSTDDSSRAIKMIVTKCVFVCTHSCSQSANQVSMVVTHTYRKTLSYGWQARWRGSHSVRHLRCFSVREKQANPQFLEEHTHSEQWAIFSCSSFGLVGWNELLVAPIAADFLRALLTLLTALLTLLVNDPWEDKCPLVVGFYHCTRSSCLVLCNSDVLLMSWVSVKEDNECSDGLNKW